MSIHTDADPVVIKQMLSQARTIAVVGLSPNPERDSNSVASYLKEQGYRIIPVNPREEEILGERCYADLKAVAEPVDIVDVFRRSEFVPEIVDQAIAIGAKAVWLQLGVRHEDAALKAVEAGLQLVQDT